MILLFTDFGSEGPYLAQMESVLAIVAPDVRVLNLVSNAPAMDPRRSGYLLAALVDRFPEGSVFVTVVDPGVGGERFPVVLEADGRWFVGPDNGLLNPAALRANKIRWWVIDWRPSELSASFHGRDLFAPIAGRIARGDFTWPNRNWGGPNLQDYPPDLAEVIYFDHYGNALTGLRYRTDYGGKELEVGSMRIAEARTFSTVPLGQAFWYRNSMDLVEIAVNGCRADQSLGLKIGSAVCVI